jgi:hypothetical protein
MDLRTTITTRRQWRFLAALLARTDYDGLPECAGDPTAIPRPKPYAPQGCACGQCGLTFVRDTPGQQYSARCAYRPKPHKRKGRRGARATCWAG